MQIETFFDVEHVVDQIIKAYPIFEPIRTSEFYKAFYPFEVCEVYVTREGDVIFIRFISYEAGLSVVVDGDPGLSDYALLLEESETATEEFDKKMQTQDLVMIEYMKSLNDVWEFNNMIGDHTGSMSGDAELQEVIITGKPVLDDIYAAITGL